MLKISEQEKSVVVAAQRGIALTERPFATLAERYSTTETDVIDLLNRLLADGTARRFGAVFDACRLGYRSALCCADIPEAKLDEIASVTVPVRGVTHLYQRGWIDELPREGIGGPGDSHWPNLWFTLAAPHGTFESEFHALRAICAPFNVYELPALRRFKIDVVFDMRSDTQAKSEVDRRQSDTSSTEACELLEYERRIVRYFEGNVPIVPNFYDAAASQLNIDPQELMQTLSRWLDMGVARRIGLLLRHRMAGFKANGMCCWSVPQSDIELAGQRLAACREVTHCYERPPLESFPFNLFAMIHTPSWDQTIKLFQRISDECALRDGRLLLSVREFKKTSMQFFI